MQGPWDYRAHGGPPFAKSDRVAAPNFAEIDPPALLPLLLQHYGMAHFKAVRVLECNGSVKLWL